MVNYEKELLKSDEFKKAEALSDEDASWYENRNEIEEESAGQA